MRRIVSNDPACGTVSSVSPIVEDVDDPSDGIVSLLSLDVADPSYHLTLLSWESLIESKQIGQRAQLLFDMLR